MRVGAGAPAWRRCGLKTKVLAPHEVPADAGSIAAERASFAQYLAEGEEEKAKDPAPRAVPRVGQAGRQGWA